MAVKTPTHLRIARSRCVITDMRREPKGREPDLLTVAEVATRLRISRTQAYRLIREGNFPVAIIVIGARQMVSRYVLERFLRGEVSPGKAGTV